MSRFCGLAHQHVQRVYAKPSDKRAKCRITRGSLSGEKTMETIANDFTINIATANGTGSQSANLILLQSLFEMGVPVSGKNMFPSNISGLPTWYIVRLSDLGYQAPGNRTHIQVLLNPATWHEDLERLEPGSASSSGTRTQRWK